MTEMPAARAAPTSGVRPKAQKRLHTLPYLLALPIIAYEGMMVVAPILQGVYASFTSLELASTKPAVWVGLANYERMLAPDSDFWGVMGTTLEITLLIILVALGAGLATALLFNRPFRGRGVARALLMMPWAFPEVPVTMIFIWILNPQFGVVNVPARMIPGVTANPQWLLVPELAIAWVVLIASWKAFPFYSLVILAALQSVPQELYEAAKVDGANALQLFTNITVPGIRTTLELLAVLASIFSFKQFSIVYLMTGGGPFTGLGPGSTETIVMRIYNAAFRFYDYSFAASIGVAGLIFSLIIAIAFVVLQNRRARENA